MALADDPLFQSPYNADSFNFDAGTPTLDEVIADALHAHALGLRVALPATVTAVGGNQQVDVQPMLMARYKNEKAASPLPIVRDVPVIMPMGQNYALRLPVAVGDGGWMMLCDRSLDAWSASGGTRPVDPQDTRAHSLSDAVFLPGLVPFGMQSTDATTDLTLTAKASKMVLAAGSTKITLTPAGQVRIENAAGQELLALVDQLITLVNQLNSNVQALTTVSAGGPGTVNPATVAILQATAAQVSALQTQLGTLTG